MDIFIVFILKLHRMHYSPITIGRKLADINSISQYVISNYPYQYNKNKTE